MAAIPGSALADWRSVNDRAPQSAGAATHPEQAAAKRLLRHPPAARAHGSGCSPVKASGGSIDLETQEGNTGFTTRPNLL
jgi:hypothetical protein